MIGASLPRPQARALASGQGRYLDDIELPRMVHVAFLRSAYAHARIVHLDISAARACPGVVAAYTGTDIAAVCTPWRTALAGLPAHVSAPQHALAIDEVCWQGEAVAAVVARSRAEAEDAIEAIEVVWEELPVLSDAAAALRPGAPRVHAALESNCALDHTRQNGDIAAAFANAAVVVEQDFTFGRQTGVSLEPRGILASHDPRGGELLIYQSHQAPFQTREILAERLGLPASRIRVICPDVGGAFGLKLHAYPDEMATAAISIMLGRPVKFVADRIESFTTDAQARDTRAHARIAADANGNILAIELDVLCGFGAYSCYPRSSVGEALQAVDMCAAPYRVPAFRGRVRAAFLNKPPTGALRAVGQPIACTVAEMLLDGLAARLGMDPVALRQRNMMGDGISTPSTAPSGMRIAPLSLHACMDAILARMDYAGLRRMRAQQATAGRLIGIGVAAFIELTGVGSALYGANKVRVAAREATRLSLGPGGVLGCDTSVNDQGQGTRAALAQIIAERLGVAAHDVRMAPTDTGSNPLGGGAWASRGMALGGEATLRAADMLRENILKIAGAMLLTPPEHLRLESASVVNQAGLAQLSLRELADAVHFLPDAIPLHIVPPLSVEASYVPRDVPYFVANGVQAALVELDAESGFIRVLGFWVAEDCGRVINPLLVDGQIRGGVVQGIGAALFEECAYSDRGQLTNGSLAEYLLPMAGDMPDIDIIHVQTPQTTTTLGAKGAGEAGTVAAGAAIWSAVNDALRLRGVAVAVQPMTPARILDALG